MSGQVLEATGVMALVLYLLRRSYLPAVMGIGFWALSLAMSALYAVLERTHAAGTREIQLVAAQDELPFPGRLFAAEPV